MTKALFFDIDGTLVSFKTHVIPASTIEALTLAHEKGIQIFIATGRPTLIINNLGELQSRGLIDGYITMNGGYCYVGDKIIYKSPIPETDVQTMARISKEKGYACIFVGEHEAWVCQPNDPLRQIFYDFLGVKEFPEVGFEEAINHEIYQMTPFFSAEDERIIAPQMPQSEFGRWYPTFVDITAKGNTKQNGIDEFIKHFGFKLEETMAFGDGGNDIGMLRHAGIGIAMGNAKDDVKASADYVTDPVDEDGIFNAMKHFGII
ncbi:MAG: Cof-type HAD-IIB family hydrolase [Bacteroidaceae bacterium]|nr:Cof-type HAD-IIB family hydrolase [Bacteroidaceae bacterium]